MKRNLRTNYFFRTIKELIDSGRNQRYSGTKQLVHFCKNEGIEVVLDIGANVGQFGLDLRRHKFDGHIISYEPVRESFNKLQSKVKNDELWTICNKAVGNKKGFFKINISGNSGLSTSFLEMSKEHEMYFPNSKFISSETVEVVTLNDEITIKKVNPSKSVLKVDAQGYEHEVLMGAKQHLKLFHFIYLELSLSPLYEKESSFLEIINFLHENNHQIIDMFRGTVTSNGKLLQVDVLTKNTA